MAAENLIKSLQDEATCSICLDYFKDPVTLNCGHNFCQACVAQYWEKSETTTACPQCREPTQQRAFRLNMQMASLVEAVQQLTIEQNKPARGEVRCERHQESLKLFCEEEQALICLICQLSREHRNHSVFPIEEAAQDYKEKIHAHLNLLKKEITERKKLQTDRRMKIQKNIQQINTEKQKVASAFQQLRQFLDTQETHLMAQFEQLKDEFVKTKDEILFSLSDDVTSLAVFIAEMEVMCKQPAEEFLQDIRITLSRCQNREFQKPASANIFPELEKKLNNLSKNNAVLAKTLKNCEGILSLGPKENNVTGVDCYHKVNVTLDQETANPLLILSADLKSVRLGDTQENPTNPKSFVKVPCVLSNTGFTSGKVTFAVDVGDTHGWAVGVARESLDRNQGHTIFSPEEGVWAINSAVRGYHALVLPRIKLDLAQKLKKVRIFLDYEGGNVVFHDDEKNAEIYHFKASFTEKIFPFCWVSGPRAKLRFY